MLRSVFLVFNMLYFIFMSLFLCDSLLQLTLQQHGGWDGQGEDEVLATHCLLFSFFVNPQEVVVGLI